MTRLSPYLRASDAFLALCTPDDTLDNGTVQCRQNIIDEIQRARQNPNLRDKIMVLKASAVRLPSNINPTYENLDPAQLAGAAEPILRQLNVWGVIPGQPRVPEVPTSSVDVGRLIGSIGLGDHDRATRLAYDTALTTSRADQAKAVRDLLHRLSTEAGDPHIVGHVLEGLGASITASYRSVPSRSCR